jgi:hypothetical protein
MVHDRRFPVEDHIYFQTTGKLLPRRISQILQELGYKVWINPKQGNDVDLKVWYDNELILVAEILNWSIKSRLSKKRRKKMISNLRQYHCDKVLIYTNLNRKHLPRFSFNGICYIKIGYQVLPKSYYEFFQNREQITNRRIDSKIVKQDIECKIKEYLRRRKI